MGRTENAPQAGVEIDTRKKRTRRQLGSITLASALLVSTCGNTLGAATIIYREFNERKETRVWPARDTQEVISDNAPMKGITWNVHVGRTVGGKRNISGVEAELKNSDADFICLQEVRGDDAEALANVFPNYTSIYDPTYVSPRLGKQPEGNMLLISSRLASADELEVNSRQLFQKDAGLLPRSITTVRIGKDATRLVLFNTHLEAKDQSTNLRQAAQANRYITAHSADAEVIGCADINADVFSSETSDRLTGNTLVAWPPPTATFGNARIDGFFSSRRSFTAGSMTVGTDRLSDHQIVSATFSERRPAEVDLLLYFNHEDIQLER